MVEPTNAEKWDAYNKCRNANINRATAGALPLLGDILTMNFPAAVVDWIIAARAAGQNFDSCYSLLPPEDREAEVQRVYDDYQQAKDDRITGKFR